MPFKPGATLSDNKSLFYYAGMMGAIALITGHLFLSGYRLTADDVEFHQIFMDGWVASWEFIQSRAFGQGRIVHFIDIPFSLIGAYYADNFYFRLFYTTLYFTNFLLIAIYISTLVRIQAAPLIFLTLLSFHSLEYFHLAPNSYPLHISIPLFIIISSRLLLLKERKDDRFDGNFKEGLILALCFLGMMFSEYGFLIGVALIAGEMFIRIASYYSESKSLSRSFLSSLLHRHTRKDLFLVVLFLLFYFGFRWLYPSSYEGNQIAREFNGASFFRALIGHIYGGTSIPSLIRMARESSDFSGHLKTLDWIAVAVLFTLTLYVSMAAINSALKRQEGPSKIVTRLWLLFYIGIAGAVIVTAPVAMTGKYQDWCHSINTCKFLDSRMSYLWLGISIASLMLLIVLRLEKYISSLYASSMIGFILALGVSLTYVHNLRMERDMKDFVSTWERAKILACLPVEELKNTDLTRRIDPKMRISHHPDFDIDRYWIRYLIDQNQKIDCGNNSRQLREFQPPVLLGKRLLAGKSGGALPLLKLGWSQPETWGTWSDGPKATIDIPFLAGHPTSIQIEGNFLLSPTHPAQGIEVLVNGVPAAHVKVTADHKGRLEVPIPEAALHSIRTDRSLRLEFHFPDAARPKDIGLGDDARELAMGLIALTLR